MEENIMRTFNITVNGNTYLVEVEEVGSAVRSVAPVAAPVAAAPVAAPVAAAPVAAPAPAAKPATPVGPVSGDPVKAPMPGTILDVKVKVGDTVEPGTVVCVLEAMKMENEIPAPKGGKIVQVVTSKGASVNAGETLVVIG